MNHSFQGMLRCETNASPLGSFHSVADFGSLGKDDFLEKVAIGHNPALPLPVFVKILLVNVMGRKLLPVRFAA
jgi:hypothetical protein